MAKIELNDTNSGYNLTAINNNFQKIATELNEKVLYRDNPDGEPNEMHNDLDMNSNRIYNLPTPTLDHEAARLKDIQEAISGNVQANVVGFTPYKDITSTNVQGAIQELEDEKVSYDDLSNPAQGSNLITYFDRTVFDRLQDYVNIKDFGAVGDGVTDDYPAIQEAITYAQSSNIRRLFIPPIEAGFLSSQNIQSSGDMEIFGAGMGQSKIIFAPTKSWTHSLPTPAFWQTPNVNIHDLSLYSSGAGISNTANGLLHITVAPGGGGTTGWTTYLNNIGISGTSAGNAPLVGLKLTNTQNLRASNVYIFGHESIPLKDVPSNSAGIIIETDSQAVDMYFNRITVDFFHYGFLLSGADAPGSGAEGIVISDSLLLGCNYGIHARTNIYLPYLVVKGCNIAAGIRCISILNWCAFQILNNFFYIRERGDDEAWAGVDYTASVVDYDFPNQISGNMFYPISFFDSPVKNGIIIQSILGAPTQVTISDNEFNHLTYGLYMGTGVTGVKLLDTNNFDDDIVQKIVDLDLSPLNVISAVPILGIAGRRSDNKGIEEKWGVSSVVIDATKRATISFPQPFKGACWNVQVTNNFANAVSSHAIVADSTGLNSFSVYIPEGTTGAGYQIAWRALGR